MLFRSLFPLLLLLLIGVGSVSGANEERDATTRSSRPRSEGKRAKQMSAKSKSEAKVQKALGDSTEDSISDKRGSKSLNLREEDAEKEESTPEEERKAEPKLREDENETGFETDPVQKKPVRQTSFVKPKNEGKEDQLLKTNQNQRQFWFGDDPPPGIHTTLYQHHHRLSCDDDKCTAKGGTWQPLEDCSGEQDRPMLYCPTTDEFCCGQRRYRHRTKRCKQSGGSCHIHAATCPGVAEKKRCRKGRKFCCYIPKPYVNLSCDGEIYSLTEGGQEITATEGRIISPGDMVRYRRYLDVSADLVLPPGHVARIEWRDIDVEENSRCMYDYVEIVDTLTGEGLEPYNISRFCGRKVPHTMDSKSNLVTLRFKTDYSVQEAGFDICFRAVQV
ncbi:uncharacterized protein LOC125037105 [Penaeus chinensis]|uniref:uncharacterized protein LOC125037105 n=1 Tax=Penaeus chinensis TaxID=139456 RepID=UPI001FB641B4|nr:uncharacterized protein LOC125037105 [Penaeus chinensis]